MTLIAVLGGGQLGRMLAIAGHSLGFRFRFLDPDPGACAGQVGELVVGAYDDPEALRQLIEGASAVTYEFENVPARAAAWLEANGPAAGLPLSPSSRSLEIAQDRLLEKQFFAAHGIAVQPFADVAQPEDLDGAAATVGFPAMLKTRRFGYDGKGQCRVDSAAALRPAWASLGWQPCILEAYVPFEREVSIVAVRGRDGQIRSWPVTRNEHRRGILWRSDVADEHPSVAQAAQRAIESVMTGLGHVGVLAIEFFVRGGSLIANEMAPRVHNSGHWTMDGAVTCQFENHLRAVAGLPLGAVEALGPATMFNLIGGRPALEELLGVPGAKVHLYGKEPRDGRKLGHVNLLNAGPAELARVEAICARSNAALPVPSSGATEPLDIHRART